MIAAPIFKSPSESLGPSHPLDGPSPAPRLPDRKLKSAFPQWKQSPLDHTTPDFDQSLKSQTRGQSAPTSNPEPAQTSDAKDTTSPQTTNPSPEDPADFVENPETKSSPETPVANPSLEAVSILVELPQSDNSVSVRQDKTNPSATPNPVLAAVLAPSPAVVSNLPGAQDDCRKIATFPGSESGIGNPVLAEPGNSAPTVPKQTFQETDPHREPSPDETAAPTVSNPTATLAVDSTASAPKAGATPATEPPGSAEIMLLNEPDPGKLKAGPAPDPIQTRILGPEADSRPATNPAVEADLAPNASKLSPKVPAVAADVEGTNTSDGTNGAKSSFQMQNREKTGQDQPVTLQGLPDSARPDSGQEGLPSGLGMNRSSSWTFNHNENALPAHSHDGQAGASPLPAVGISDGIHLPSARSADAASPSSLERLHLQIANGAMELRAARAGSMSVVIRPDAHTEMVLHLKLQNGLVNVEAQMQRGDSASLHSHWGQLQQTLSHQGIRLNSLVDPERASHPSPGSFSGNSPDQERPAPPSQDERQPAAPRTGLSSRPAPAPVAAATTSSARGLWESWA
jgi:hypothetical protein